MIVGGVLNGVIRELILNLLLPPRTALLVSGLILILIVVFIESIFIRQHLARLSRFVAWQLGLFWVALTVGFEFGFGRWVMGHSWEHLLKNYDIWTGNLWSAALVMMLVAPVILYQRQVRRV